MSFLRIRSLAKSFGDHLVLEGIDLSVEPGEIVALLGPSGSGKTTLLRLLAGFERPDAGSMAIEGDAFVHLAPARRDFGMVFQHYALFPHMTVGENVAFGLHGRSLSGGEIDGRVAEVLGLVDLSGFERRRVSEISGGQQQRVALARALAPKPRLLLLDEPLSNLDPELRERTRQRLKATLSRIGITTVLVTHEQDEAFDLGDRVAVLHRGRLEQVDTPQTLYRAPKTPFVAGFVGRASLLRGEIEASGKVRVGRDAAGQEVLWEGHGDDGRDDATDDRLATGSAVDLAVRPESVELVRPGTPRALPGRVVEGRFSGAVSYVVVELEDGQRLEVAAETSSEMPAEVRIGRGESVGVARRAHSLYPRIFPPPTEGPA